MYIYCRKKELPIRARWQKERHRFWPRATFFIFVEMQLSRMRSQKWRHKKRQSLIALSVCVSLYTLCVQNPLRVLLPPKITLCNQLDCAPLESSTPPLTPKCYVILPFGLSFSGSEGWCPESAEAIEIFEFDFEHSSASVFSISISSSSWFW